MNLKPTLSRYSLPARLALLVLLAGSFPAPAPAQPRVDAIPDSVLRPYSVREIPPAPTFPATHVPQLHAAPLPGDDDGRRLRDYSMLGGAVQLEAPRQSIDGTYKRPRIIVGLPSESMKSWMNSAGFTTEKCLLPMVRARARVQPEGAAGFAIVVDARCTFQ
jgi:hypothetical protein